MPITPQDYNGDAILGEQLSKLMEKEIRDRLKGDMPETLAHALCVMAAEIDSLKAALAAHNLGERVADSLDAQSLKVGGEDVTDASNHTATFSRASSRTDLTTGEKLSAMFGKIAKWLADLKTVAFTGSYNDLSNKPTIPASKTTTNVFIGYSVDTSSAVSKITVNSYEFLNAREYHLFFSLKSSIELSSYTKDSVKLRFYIGGVSYAGSPWRMTAVIQVVNGVAKLNTSILPFNWKGEGIVPELYEIANYLQIDFVDVDNDSVVYMASGQFINVVIRGTESY